ncbi:SMI1/KNR4 family protein [Eikenella sp. S3360]|uniref:SMI1/KNR4 family protein n=1 Tax=Eikenella glucosivorans TaxID=2766967 RepID=A0ABS0NDI6_9NEIS|nr:SMI1/KNR4 family protein [Eikenella glucosivorans]MBH5330359.1 SMI1/KNR4 family protein [Eikenella glucosivorans]
MTKPFQDFDLSSVWEPNGYADKHYKEAPFTPETLAEVEMILGYKLPQSFIALMAIQNGGTFRNKCYPTTQPTSWSDNHVVIEEVSGIGLGKAGSLCGEMGQKLWLGDWGYPPIGVYFANDPTAGHAMFALDYRQCGKNGEPEVVLVEQERDYEIIKLAPDFETFIRHLQHEDNFSD